MAKILLEMKNITKTFPGVKALDNVNLQVEEGDYIAIAGKSIISSGKERKKVVLQLLDKLFENDEKELITLIVGEDKDDREVAEIESYINENSDLECEIIDGGQPVYSYLIGLE